jgi:hypothetical protein
MISEQHISRSFFHSKVFNSGPELDSMRTSLRLMFPGDKSFEAATTAPMIPRIGTEFKRGMPFGDN